MIEGYPVSVATPPSPPGGIRLALSADHGTHTGVTYLMTGTLHYLQGFLQRETCELRSTT
jgi:hypothetical protein